MVNRNENGQLTAVFGRAANLPPAEANRLTVASLKTEAFRMRGEQIIKAGEVRAELRAREWQSRNPALKERLIRIVTGRRSPQEALTLGPTGRSVPLSPEERRNIVRQVDGFVKELDGRRLRRERHKEALALKAPIEKLKAADLNRAKGLPRVREDFTQRSRKGLSEHFRDRARGTRGTGYGKGRGD